ncbi:Uroporphyrinogen-III C-methyltransferase [Corynebacterium provencense]|uniref:uroporphyrinogen-III C-methyltransferase n=1 Tax=Corynebacterium provencense TaxID=1737425 RepID=A0A2Z3YNN2_9CORY|nr:uroporphyrinogen-III C-methyltransferase [Corynebacterium provencense]AWT25998.1 Uroporphyrinogen-III C-methyltransferase [Corynebacterium provencense]
MSLVLAGVTVLLVDGPETALAADLLREQGAVPVNWGGHGTDGPEGIGLVRIPAGAAADRAAEALEWARRHGVPVDDRRGVPDHGAHGAHAVPGKPGAHGEDAGAEEPAGTTGEVILVGGGPGDPGLITVAGARALESADVILADHLGPVSLAEEAARRGAELIDVAKIPYSRQVSQDRINELMVDNARKGRTVVRLKGGDPFIFGRGFEEIEACTAAGIPVRVIPGVTSMTAAPAAAGLSLTHRGLNHDLTLVSGHVPPDSPKSLVNWDACAKMTGTLVLIMAVKNAGAIAATLIDRGRDAATPAVVVENASTPSQRVTTATLGTLGETVRSTGVRSPAVIVIGDAAGRTAHLC